MLSRLLHNLPEANKEIFEELARLGTVRIERITTPPQRDPGPVYDQAHDEWVLVLQGWADLSVTDNVHHLAVGDAIMLPAHVKHQVLRTSPDEPTVWLALHGDG